MVHCISGRCREGTCIRPSLYSGSVEVEHTSLISQPNSKNKIIVIIQCFLPSYIIVPPPLSDTLPAATADGSDPWPRTAGT